MTAARKWAYYNDVDEYCCAWTKNLIKAGLIPDGEVDSRSIRDVKPDDLRDFKQCHFFSGIAGFAYAARLAGWSDTDELWTGGFPCQPFSVAGRQLAQQDDRHLWPELARLIGEVRPAVFLGENVAGIVGLALDGVQFDLEGAGYCSRAFIVPACAVDAPNRRDRVWILAKALGDAAGSGRDAARGAGGAVPASGQVERSAGRGRVHGGGSGGAVADACGIGRDGRQDPAGGHDADRAAAGRGESADRAELRGEAGGGHVGDADGAGPQEHSRQRGDNGAECAAAVGAGGRGDVEHAAGVGRREGRAGADVRGGRDAAAGAGGGCCDVGDADKQHDDGGRYGAGDDGRKQPVAPVVPGSGGNFWSDAAWISGRDGKARRVPVEPFRGMANGLSPRIPGMCSNDGPEEEVTSGQASKTSGSETMRDVRRDDGAETLQRAPGGSDGVQSPPTLLAELREHADGSRSEAATQEGAEVSRISVRALRGSGQTARPSSGREPGEQRPVEPTDIVRLVSSSLALGQWEDRIEAAIGLHGLLDACANAGHVPETLSAFPALWRSMSYEARGRVGQILLGSGNFAWRARPLLTRGEPARVQKLKALGNAINPHVAAEILRAMRVAP